MDIDILQVQENVTVDADGAVIFPIVAGSGSAAETDASQPNNLAAAVAMANINNGNGKDATVNSHQESNNQQQQLQHQQLLSATKTMASSLTTNNVEHCNNDCGALQPTLPIQPQQPRPPTPTSDNNPLWWRENLNLDKSKLVLIGFSKGCVVLNQVSPVSCKNR